jgi:hypothetical protein
LKRPETLTWVNVGIIISRAKLIVSFAKAKLLDVIAA